MLNNIEATISNNETKNDNLIHENLIGTILANSDTNQRYFNTTDFMSLFANKNIVIILDDMIQLSKHAPNKNISPIQSLIDSMEKIITLINAGFQIQIIISHKCFH